MNALAQVGPSEAPEVLGPPPVEDQSDAARPAPATQPVGRVIAERLAAAGVRYAFTVPGESFLGLLDGLVEAGIRVIGTRHEGGAAFMAAAATQMIGRPQACLATRAVGTSNLAIGIHAARADSLPMIALAGQVQRPFRGRDAFQEADLVGSLGRLAKWAIEIRSPSSALEQLDEALLRALEGRPGPILVAVPEDVLEKETSPASSGPPVPRVPSAEAAEIRAVLHLMAGSRRGVVLAGAGVQRGNAGRRVLRLAEILGVPIIASWRRPDVVANGHPLYLGMAGYGGPATVKARLEEADALLVLGCRLNEPTSFGYRVPGPGTRWAQVDLEPLRERAGLSAPDIAVTSEVGRFLDAALELLRAGCLEAAPRAERIAAAATDRDAYLAASIVDDHPWSGPGVHPGRIVATLRRVLSPETMLTTDAGNFGGWIARGYRFRRPGTFLGSSAGAMGYAIPAAIAASVIRPDRPVVALVGDGGFGMSMNELETAVREGASPIVLVFDNRRYGTIAMHQTQEGRPTTASELGPIDVAGVARGLGAQAWTVTEDEAFEGVMTEVLAAGGPRVVHLALDPGWVSVDQVPHATA